MYRFIVGVMLVTIAAATLSACAGSSSGGGPDRTFSVAMSDDMRYAPDHFDVTAGETVRFEVTNTGQLRHEFFVGDVQAHDDHAAEMASMASHPMGHDEPSLLVLGPGERGVLDYTFSDRVGLQIGCHEPGHYEAGMVATITVHP